MNTFSLVFWSELLKVKNTFALWLVVFAALSIPLFVAIEFANEAAKIISVLDSNPWDYGWIRSIRGIAIFSAPATIVVLTALLVNIEYKNNTWKHVLTLPVSKKLIYINKLLVTILLLLLFYILFVVFFLIAGGVLGFYLPKTHLLDHTPDITEMLRLSLRSFIASLTILAIHFWMNFRVKNMFITMGIGLMLVFIAMPSFSQFENTFFFPYNYSLQTAFHEFNGPGILAKQEIYSLLLFGLICLLSYFDFVNKFKG